MNDVSKGEGRTVLFVSHNMTAVRSLCNKSILLQNGMILDQGPTENIVTRYLRGDSAVMNHKVWNTDVECKAQGFELLEIGIRRRGDDWNAPMPMDEDIELLIRYRLTKDFDKFWICLEYKNDMGEKIFSSCGNAEDVPRQQPQGEYLQTCVIPANSLNWGGFSFNLLALCDDAQLMCRADDVCSFTVVNKAIEVGGYMGKEPGDLTPHFPFNQKRL